MLAPNTFESKPLGKGTVTLEIVIHKRYLTSIQFQCNCRAAEQQIDVYYIYIYIYNFSSSDSTDIVSVHRDDIYTNVVLL